MNRIFSSENSSFSATAHLVVAAQTSFAISDESKAYYLIEGEKADGYCYFTNWSWTGVFETAKQADIAIDEGN